MDLFIIFILACQVLAPLLAYLRGWPPAALFAVAATVYAILSGMSIVGAQLDLGDMLLGKSVYHDSYYTVGPGHTLLDLGVVMALFAVVTWLQSRLGAMIYPKATKALFWLLHLGMLGANTMSAVVMLFLPTSQGVEGFSELVRVTTLTNSWVKLLSSIVALSFVGLLGLFLWSSNLAWRARLKS
ncbi:hypothetical protein ACEN2S_20830 [Phaeovulum sp. W22_SRMD_FR3]